MLDIIKETQVKVKGKVQVKGKNSQPPAQPEVGVLFKCLAVFPLIFF